MQKEERKEEKSSLSEKSETSFALLGTRQSDVALKSKPDTTKH